MIFALTGADEPNLSNKPKGIGNQQDIVSNTSVKYTSSNILYLMRYKCVLQENTFFLLLCYTTNNA